MSVYYRLRENRSSPKTHFLTLNHSKALKLWTALEPNWPKNPCGFDIWFETGHLKNGEVNFKEIYYTSPGVYTPTDCKSPKPRYEDPGYDVPTLSTFFP